MGRRRITQRDFIAVARDAAEVTYHHPGTFRAGAHEITVPARALARFACRLSSVMSLQAYDRLTRAVWLAHLRAVP